MPGGQRLLGQPWLLKGWIQSRISLIEEFNWGASACVCSLQKRGGGPNEGWNLISICLLLSPLAFQCLMSSPWDTGAPSFCLGQRQSYSLGEICVTLGVGGFFLSSLSDFWMQLCINIQDFALELKYLFKKHQIMSSFSPRA